MQLHPLFVFLCTPSRTKVANIINLYFYLCKLYSLFSLHLGKNQIMNTSYNHFEFLLKYKGYINKLFKSKYESFFYGLSWWHHCIRCSRVYWLDPPWGRRYVLKGYWFLALLLLHHNSSAISLAQVVVDPQKSSSYLPNKYFCCISRQKVATRSITLLSRHIRTLTLSVKHWLGRIRRVWSFVFQKRLLIIRWLYQFRINRDISQRGRQLIFHR